VADAMLANTGLSQLVGTHGCSASVPYIRTLPAAGSYTDDHRTRRIDSVSNTDGADENRLGNVSPVCVCVCVCVFGRDCGDHLLPVRISARGSGLIDVRVKSLGDDDEERCVKREMKAATSEETDA